MYKQILCILLVSSSVFAASSHEKQIQSAIFCAQDQALEKELLGLFTDVPSYAVPMRSALKAKADRALASKLSAVVNKVNLIEDATSTEGLAVVAAVQAGESFAISGVALDGAQPTFCYAVLTGRGVFKVQPKKLETLRQGLEPVKKAVAPFREMAFLR